MYPLIEITTVPIEIEMKVTDAKLEYTRGSAELEITRGDGGLNIRSRPIRLNLDTFEMRNSIVPTPMRATLQGAEKGRQAAYEATAVYARQGQVMLNARIGEQAFQQLDQEAQARSVKTNVNVQFLPSVGPDISWDPAQLNIRYEMDKLNFNWRVNQPSFSFTPGDIEISVTQQPDVIIKYVGGPLYVPPSADPAHEPADEE